MPKRPSAAVSRSVSAGKAPAVSADAAIGATTAAANSRTDWRNRASSSLRPKSMTRSASGWRGLGALGAREGGVAGAVALVWVGRPQAEGGEVVGDEVDEDLADVGVLGGLDA